MSDPMNTVYKHLRNAGGSTDMNVNGSITPVPFFYEAPARHYVFLHRMLFSMEDVGMTWLLFGGIAALTNGLKLEVQNSVGGVILDLLDGHTLKSNSDIAEYMYDVTILSKGSTDFMSSKWMFREDTRHALVMEPGDKFVITVQDDLSLINTFEAQVRGDLEYR